MPRQKRAKPAGGTASRAGSLIIASGAFLALGLSIGYYLGKLSPRAAIPEAGEAPRVETQSVDFIRAEASLKSVLQVKPGDLPTLIELGNLYYDNGRFQEAAEHYGRALEQDPGNVAVRTDRGTCLYNLGRVDEAIAEFRKSLEFDPSHPQTLYNLGVVYLHGKNDPLQARAAWERLLAANPSYPQRARLQEMIASLSDAAGSPQPARSAEDLLERLKKR